MIETRKREHSRKPDEQYTHRGVLAGPVPGDVRPLPARWLDGMGKRGRPMTFAPRGRQYPAYR